MGQEDKGVGGQVGVLGVKEGKERKGGRGGGKGVGPGKKGVMSSAYCCLLPMGNQLFRTPPI